MNDQPSPDAAFGQALRQLEIKHLMAFEAIYSTRNISRAGQALGFSQPTMSTLLATLRAVLDDRLFLRQPRGVQPTSRADELITPVRSALREIERITMPRASFDPTRDTREFKIHALDLFESLLIPHLVNRVAGNPGITFKLLLAPKVPIVEALQSGEADIALGMGPPNQPDLRWQDILSLDLVVIARKGHPRIDGHVTLQDLAELGHVAMDMAPGALANSHLFSLKNRPARRDVVRVTRPSAIIEIVAQTDLVGYANRAQLDASPWRDRLQALEPPVPLSTQDFQMTWHLRNQDDPSLVWLREEIGQILGRV